MFICLTSSLGDLSSFTSLLCLRGQNAVIKLAVCTWSALAYGRTIAMPAWWVNRKKSIVQLSYLQKKTTKIYENSIFGGTKQGNLGYFYAKSTLSGQSYENSYRIVTSWFIHVP